MPYVRGMRYPLTGGITHGQRNLLTKSSDFSNAVWVTGSGGAATVTANSLEDTSAAAVQGRRQAVPSVSGILTHTGSVELKADTSSIASIRVEYLGATAAAAELVIDLTSGIAQWRTLVIGTRYDVIHVGDGWYRIYVSMQDNNTGNTTIGIEIRPAFAATFTGTISATVLGKVLARNAQLESSRTGTPYQAVA